MALAKYRDFSGAVEALERGLKIAPGSVPLLVDLAAALLNNGELERSMALTLALQTTMPGHPWPIINEAQVHLRANRFAESEQALLKVPEGLRDPVEWGIVLGTVLVARRDWGRAEDVLKEVVDSPRASGIGKALAQFQVAKMREKQGDYDGSWAAATEAHRLVDRPTTSDRYRREAEAIREVMDRDALQGWACASQPCEQAVFIVGMPRSGTSLLEQILSMHPDVANAGELAVASTLQRRLPLMTDSFLAWPRCIADMQDRDADELQATYRREIELLGPGKRRVTDKSLLLVFQMGLLSRLLPGARSIMLRRHPLDTIVSCYTTHLACIGHAYTSDVKVLAEVWKLRDGLQDFWMENLDPAPLDLHYERLVSDQEAETRRILEHLGLPWTDACLRFHESERVARTISFDQVNQKMYTSSVERWRRYEKHLGPAIDILGL